MREHTHVTKVSFAEFPDPEKPGAVIVTGPHSTNVQVLADVLAERARQDAKWGEQNHRDGTGPRRTPLDRIGAQLDGPLEYETAQHLANAAKEATDVHAKRGTVTWTDILLEEVFEALAEGDSTRLRAELIQVAAVAVQWAEAIDRRSAAVDAGEEAR